MAVILIYTVKKEIKCTGVSEILHENQKSMKYFVWYHELLRVVSRNPATFNFFSNSVWTQALKVTNIVD